MRNGDCMSKVIRARAPSNIALVKYMGKVDSQLNLPANSSLSMTLGDLSTLVEVEVLRTKTDFDLKWSGECPSRLPNGPWAVPEIGAEGIRKIEKHFQRVRSEAGEIFEALGVRVKKDPGCILLRSANNFPPASGIASSASSFAAMTLAFLAAQAEEPEEFIQKFAEVDFETLQKISSLSRKGSGSSCRSFGGPWVEWTQDRISVLDFGKLPKLAHFVLLIKSSPKKVSSSEAHRRVLSSPLWNGRIQRAEKRVLKVRESILNGDFRTLALEAWQEAWEMHSLFHTSESPFTYWEPETVSALQFFSRWIEESSAAMPPVVTLDAGPNVHLIVPEGDREVWKKRLQSSFPGMEFLQDSPGLGARFET